MTEKGIRVFVTNTGFVSCTNVFSDEPNGYAFTDQQLAELKQEYFEAGREDCITIPGMKYSTFKDYESKKGGQDDN